MKKEKQVKIYEPKKYHIIFSKDMTMESLSKILNEMNLAFNDKKIGEQFKKIKLEGIKIVLKQND